MKMYAFVRSNVNKSLETMPSFKSYFYFLFAPTLIFNEDYPRNPVIRWRFVVQCLVEVATGVLLIAAILDLYILSIFEDFGTEPITPVDFVDRMFSCIMPGLVVAVTGFYCFFHSWMNGFAEVLRFADREFYSDWWTATSFREFHRKLNTVVQEWIYFYLYRDLRSIFKRKFNCLLVTGVIIALALEYVLSLGTRMVVPIFGWILLVQPVLIHWTGSGRYINFIICLGMSLCIMFSLSRYSMEIFARRNRK
jgi:sterol O-acyltransferase